MNKSKFTENCSMPPKQKKTNLRYLEPTMDKLPEVIFTKISINADYNSRDPRSKKLPVFTVLENVAEEANKLAPTGMKNIRQTSRGWTYMPSEQMLVQNAIQGICISVAFAFIILLIATGNIIQASASIFCVALVILSITAAFQINGQ
jgi:hypothetical protein